MERLFLPSGLDGITHLTRGVRDSKESLDIFCTCRYGRVLKAVKDSGRGKVVDHFQLGNGQSRLSCGSFCVLPSDMSRQYAEVPGRNHCRDGSGFRG